MPVSLPFFRSGFRLMETPANKRLYLLPTLTLLAGAATTLAFAPFAFWPLAFITPAILVLCCYHASPKQALLYGWLFGFGFIGTGISWVYISLNVYGEAPPVLAGIMTLIMIAVLASYIGIACYLLNRFFPHARISKWLLAFPCLWVIAEGARQWILTGFPWLLLGYSQIDTPLRGLAPITSVYGVSWMVAATSGALAITLRACVTRFKKHSIVSDGQNTVRPYNQKSLLYTLILIIALWLAAVALSSVQWTKPASKPITVSLVQGDIPTSLKWEAAQAEKTLRTYQQLTAPHWGNELIIWPEGAVTFLQTEAQPYLQQLAQRAKAHDSTLLTGIPIQQGNRYYNGMLAMGEGSGMYLKRHLVPFGEFIPFRSLIDWLQGYLQIPMSDFSPGERYQPLIRLDHTLLATFICYEIAYPTEVLDSLPAGQLLVVISDDSWFGKSIAAEQHLEIAQMRALETGRYLVMGTNDGITAIVNARGQVQALAPRYEATVLTGEITPMQGATPWVKTGFYPWAVLLLVLLLFAYWRQRVGM
jgi:apolipoprotein N-acyltransferase